MFSINIAYEATVRTVYDFFAQDVLNFLWYFTWYLTCISLDLSHIQLGFHIAFHMIFHMVTIFTSIFTGILPYLLHSISHIFNVVFHMPYREIPSENAEPISQGFHMIIFTWYFTFLWNNARKTMCNPFTYFVPVGNGISNFTLKSNIPLKSDKH